MALSSSERLGLRIGILGADLLWRSRVAAALGEAGAELKQVGPGPLPPGLDLLLVDLNRDPGERLQRLTGLLSAAPKLEVVCYGPHAQMAGLSPEARRRGARRCVANSQLQHTLRRFAESRRGLTPYPEGAA
ncbi:MAG: hypothetical protein ACREOL_03680 [Candidatus Dormibacteria bacterium]